MKKILLLALFICIAQLNAQVCFTSATSYSVVASSSPISITTADFDGDGNADLVSTLQSANEVAVFFGNGTGNFGTPSYFATGTNPEYAACADYNGDGKIDIATANYSGGISVLINNGVGGFNSAMSYTTGSNAQNIIADDFNNDLKPDLIVANYTGNNISILINNEIGRAHV